VLFSNEAVLKALSSLKVLCSIKAVMLIVMMFTGSSNLSVRSLVVISMRSTFVSMGGVVSAVKLLTGAGLFTYLAGLGYLSRSKTTAARMVM